MAGAGPLSAAHRALLLALPAALAATGCGTLRAAEPEALAPGTVTTAPTGLTPGPYALTTAEGAVITFDLPTVPPPDDEVEQLRQELHVEPVTYVELHIDNTEGTRTVQFDDLKVISHEGGQFPFHPAADVLPDWDPNRFVQTGYWAADGTLLDPREGAALDARVHALIAEYTGPVPPGTVGRELMIGDFDHLPQTFDDVELSPYPHERALGPAPVGHGPEERRYRPGVPDSAADGLVEQEQAPQAPARPAAPEPEPPQPTTGPEPVYVPDCADPASPSGPEQVDAWNAVCAPAPEEPTAPVPTEAPAPEPTGDPTSEPTRQPTPGPTGTVAQPEPTGTVPTGEETAGPPAEETGTSQLAEGPAATASPSPARRRPRPSRSAAPTPNPTPTPTAASTAAAPAPAEAAASRLPSGRPAA